MSAADHSGDTASLVRAFQDESPEHADCPNGVWDEDYGPVCGCGVLLAEPVEAAPRQLPASATTADADPSRHATTGEAGQEIATQGGIASAVAPADPITAALEVIDPNAPYDSKMVEEHMLDVMARLERGAHYQRVCEEEAYNAKLAYEMAHARAILDAQKQGGAADVRSAAATLACEEEYTRKMVADMKVKAIRETMHSLRSVLSGYQSVGKSISAAYTGGGSNGPAF